MNDDRDDKIRDRAYEIWQREGGGHGDHDRHWHQAEMEIDREAALPLTADDALPQTRLSPTGEIASTDVLTAEDIAMRTGISGDEAQQLIDRLGTDRAAIEDAARGLKAKRGR
ncbi:MULTISPECIES: DUF2934 domain-containing protein [unclassified Mesorhizobium]|uniref:DUF2934 domain-containing protein n=1 Tax=unclassified Mesorhizobium TaxID=325217 RepID=UPI001CCC163E|nr:MULTISPECIES: DUF2934 domain-containing protein [unclassified Mesorhizobium]MBZ9742056.1 DUF2934 domain-containing protein [Mesorhizobium sp. CO1-1-4]MBZ9805995.1 DUF2934 domain-containing protein [Mesorhizobium sp. ES1-6]